MLGSGCVYQLLRRENLDLKLTPYHSLAVSPCSGILTTTTCVHEDVDSDGWRLSGFVECVPNTTAVADVLGKDGTILVDYCCCVR